MTKADSGVCLLTDGDAMGVSVRHNKVRRVAVHVLYLQSDLEAVRVVVVEHRVNGMSREVVN